MTLIRVQCLLGNTQTSQYTTQQGLKVYEVRVDEIEIIPKCIGLNEPVLIMDADGGYVYGAVSLKDIIEYTKRYYPELL